MNYYAKRLSLHSLVLNTQHSALSTRYSVPRMRRRCLSWFFTILFAAASSAHAQPDAAPAEWLQDAELTAVTFVDADHGWAVGDRGVIWHTSDGGRTWKLQKSGVT